MDPSLLLGLGRREQELHQQVSFNGKIKRIRELRNLGANLESTDLLGRTPLMVASMARGNQRKAEVLLQYGAYVDAYRPGPHGGTALHHAADCNAEETVKLLLSYGASHYIRNDVGNTALDLAREKGYLKVIVAIEEHISLFRGWMREKYGLFRTRRIWAVVLPFEEDPTTSHNVELAIYPEFQASTPSTVIKLWASQVMAPKLNKEDPFITILDERTKTRYKILSPNRGDKSVLQRFYDACRGISQVTNMVLEEIPNSLPANSPLAPSEPSTSNEEDAELAMAISASIQSAIAEGVPNVRATASATNTNAWRKPPVNNGWDVPETSSNPSSSKPNKTSANPGGNEANESSYEDTRFGACVICHDAPVQGACVPCGHTACCMSCLKNIENRKPECPICRAPIDQVLRLYPV